MRLSDQPEYGVAIPAAVEGDYATARDTLEVLIARARSEGDDISAGSLLQTLGDVEARAGNLELGHSLHREAVELDPSSPLPLLLYAKGCLWAFRRSDLALERIAEAEALLMSDRWTPGEDELSREWYEREFRELRESVERDEP